MGGGGEAEGAKLRPVSRAYLRDEPQTNDKFVEFSRRSDVNAENIKQTCPPQLLSANIKMELLKWRQVGLTAL